MKASSLEEARKRVSKVKGTKVQYILEYTGERWRTLESWKKGVRISKEVRTEYAAPTITGQYFYRIGKSGFLEEANSLEEATLSARKASLSTDIICYVIVYGDKGFEEIQSFRRGKIPQRRGRPQEETWYFRIGRTGYLMKQPSREAASNLARQRSFEVRSFVYVLFGSKYVERWGYGKIHLDFDFEKPAAEWSYRIGKKGNKMSVGSREIAIRLAKRKSLTSTRICYVMHNNKVITRFLRGKERAVGEEDFLKEDFPKAVPALTSKIRRLRRLESRD